MIIIKLNEFMNNMGLSQRELSRITGIRQASISAYCNNTFKMIPKDHLAILCKLFECKVGDILEFIDEKESEDK